MIETYFPVLVMIVVAGGFVATMLILASILGPKRHTPVKDDPFECGTVATGEVGGRFSVKFYLVAVIFILFDMEVVFLYPWAIKLREFGWQGFFVAFPFLLILTIALIYEWKRGVLDWSK